MATIRDMKSETRNEMPSGFSMRPSIPERKNKGRKETMMMKVALRMEVLISEEALKTTSKCDCCNSFGFNLFCFNLLYTFSTSMMASSTNDPTAMAMPPKLIVLMVMPNNFKVMMVANNDNGMAKREIRVVRKLPRNRNNMRMTRMLPSIKARSTLLTEVWMKSA